VADVESKTETKNYSFLSDVSMLLPLCVVYIFLSGWAFDDYYFRFFGLDPKFLDVGFHDTLVRGFTVIFIGARWLSTFYVALFLTPPILNISSWRPLIRLLLMAVLFVGLLPAVYLISRSAGEQKARIDAGSASTLPAMTFTFQKRSLVGKLLYLKGDLYFIHRVRPSGGEDDGNIELSAYKASEIEDVRIVGHE
jgi:hypothetical protein